MNIYKLILIGLYLIFYLLLSGCAQNQATGQRQLVLLSPEQEQDIGSKEHPKVLKAFGGIYEKDELNNYVSSLGEKLAKLSEQPNIRWKFTVLDSPLVNAFALPGGYVYISRGLLSLTNDESELASVLGHEIAHITARHTAQRHAKSTISEIGLNILDIVVGQPIISNAASLGARGAIAAFSRSEEIEADIIGKRYIISAGYDSNASYRFLKRLNDLTELSNENNKNFIVSIFATHPRTEERMKKVKDDIFYNDEEAITNRNNFLAVINNITYGESSKNGIVKDNKFLHIPLNIAFSVPDGFEIENKTNAVIARGKDSHSILIFDGLINQDNLDLLDLVESNIGRSRTNFIDNVTIYNQPAIIVKDRELVEFEKQRYTRRIVLIKWYNSRVWRFNILTDESRTRSSYESILKKVFDFHQLSEEELLIAQPKRIKIYVTNKGDTLSSLSKMMSVEDKKLEWIKILNGFSADVNKDTPIEPGTLIKLIVG